MMQPLLGLLAAGIVLAMLQSSAPARPMSAFDHEFEAIEGGKLPLAQWRGKVLLIVNTASFCGFTPQYEGLQKLWERYEAKGLVVVGVPSTTSARRSPRRKPRSSASARAPSVSPSRSPPSRSSRARRRIPSISGRATTSALPMPRAGISTSTSSAAMASSSRATAPTSSRCRRADQGDRGGAGSTSVGARFAPPPAATERHDPGLAASRPGRRVDASKLASSAPT